MKSTGKSPKLTINRETIRELDSGDLVKAAGGQNSLICYSLVPTKCCTGYYPSINAPCTTN